MKEICDPFLCSGCAACANICAKNAISLQYDKNGFLKPEILTEKCVDCKRCQTTCPQNQKPLSTLDLKDIAIFVSNNNDDYIHSSSGGAFNVLVREVLRQNGVIFGCMMDDEYNVKHAYAQSDIEARAFNGSKYTQSRIGLAYKKCKSFLDNNRLVLFSGLPCQIDGLNHYLGKSYQNLLTVDLVCHGVASQKFFHSYVTDVLSDPKIDRFTFRRLEKKNNNSKTYIAFEHRDYYMTPFMWSMSYGSQCYHCKYPGHNRVADFTLMDTASGILKEHDINVEYGSSNVIFNTEKAKEYIPVFMNNGTYCEITKEELLKYGGGQLIKPSYGEKRSKYLYFFYRCFGINGVKFFNKVANIIFKIKRIGKS